MTSEKDELTISLKNKWSIAAIVFAFLFIVTLSALFATTLNAQPDGDSSTACAITPAAGEDAAANGTAQTGLGDEELSSEVESFLNENFLQPQGLTSEVVSIEEYDGYLSMVTVNVLRGEETIDSASVLVTKDGSTVIFGEAFSTEERLIDDTAAPDQGGEADGTQPDASTAEKVETPTANAFIMSFCPYGLQFMKAYVPVIELLGDKADIQMNFVSYAMHGLEEIEGNNYMYCAQRESSDKFTDYVTCFVESGDYEACVATAGLDSSKIDSCISEINDEYGTIELYNDQSTWSGGRFPQYPVEAELNSLYGVRGSPTFVLNGQQVSVSRSAEAIKDAICATFENPPEECDVELSSSDEAPGLGPIGSGSAAGTTASCG